jgi:hypothetical protein
MLKFLLPDAVVERCFVNAAVQEKTSKICAEKPVRTISHHSRIALPAECKFCFKMFPSKTAAENHVFSTHRVVNNKCVHCEVSFRSTLSLKTHLIDVHTKKFRCNHCGMQTNRLHAHMLEMHSTLFMCKYRRCIKVFKTNSDKLKHEKEFHEMEGVYKCIYCDELEYLSRISLLRHLQMMHKDKSLQCDCTSWCKKFFLTEAEKVEHVKIDHISSAIEIECEICKKKLRRPHLNAHMQQFHGRRRTFIKSGDTDCCYCPKKFPDRGSAFRHVKEAHFNIETFKCYDCEIFFENVELKKEHYQKTHRGHFRCIYCVNWECTNRMNLRRHMRIKHQGEVIQCKFSMMCRLYFKTQDDLIKHTRENHEVNKTRQKL